MKTIENVNASQVKDRISSVSRPQNLLAKHFILVRQSDVVMQQARFGQPMRLNERRFLHILNGQAVYRINLLDYTLRQGDFLVLPPDTIVEVVSISDDYAVEALLIIDLSDIDHETAKRLFPVDVLRLSLSEEDVRRVGAYFDLLSVQIAREEHSDSAISFLILSMMADMNKLQQTLASSCSHRKLSRSEEIMSRFVTLLRQYGTRERNIPFYASQLAITANHLSDVVRQQSGLSVMDWLNRTTITEAKVLLKHSDLMIYEIGERLNFPEPTAFNRYFKKHVGMTPLEYRENN
ncbi:MAG: helix-turn-helix domain-containing protein [Paludibacteraceae bacterium]|nr:helix-turn-helix domain-containing protein [Paludibacteraceae bacterium]